MTKHKPYDLKSQFLDAVAERGGWANTHAHFDKAYYITKEGLSKSMLDMEEKWNMSDDIKRNSTQEEVEARLRTAIQKLVDQGVQATMTFVDAYDAVGTKNIDAAIKVREEFKDEIDIYYATQPLGGLIDPAAVALYEELTARVDIAGGLPSYDRPNDAQHYDTLFSIAKNLDKPMHVHVDQENNPNERDTEKLIEYVKKYGYEGRVTLVHGISVSAQPQEYRTRIYKELADLGINVAVCASAALGMRQLDQFQSPVHNSIGNIPEMLEAGVTVGMGVDNVCDFYHPFVDADMWVEMRMIQEACRLYDFDALLDVATTNGLKILHTK